MNPGIVNRFHDARRHKRRCLPADLAGILAAQRFPEEQLAAIFDAEGTIAARTIAPETYVGQKGVADFIARISYPHVEKDEIFDLPGIVSRKKQLIPYLSSILKELQGGAAAPTPTRASSSQAEALSA